ncbi:hypothetical protein BDZ89DRAFT_1084529, partial [Hymenopellis radicata]
MRTFLPPSPGVSSPNAPLSIASRSDSSPAALRRLAAIRLLAAIRRRAVRDRLPSSTISGVPVHADAAARLCGHSALFLSFGTLGSRSCMRDKRATLVD